MVENLVTSVKLSNSVLSLYLLIARAVKEEDAEAQHAVHDGKGSVQSNILKIAKQFFFNGDLAKKAWPNGMAPDCMRQR